MRIFKNSFLVVLLKKKQFNQVTSNQVLTSYSYGII